MSLNTIPHMPSGYTLVVTQGRGWVSYGWVLHVDGRTAAVRVGHATALAAWLSALDDVVLGILARAK